MYLCTVAMSEFYGEYPAYGPTVVGTGAEVVSHGCGLWVGANEMDQRPLLLVSRS